MLHAVNARRAVTNDRSRSSLTMFFFRALLCTFFLPFSHEAVERPKWTGVARSAVSELGIGIHFFQQLGVTKCMSLRKKFNSWKLEEPGFENQIWIQILFLFQSICYCIIIHNQMINFLNLMNDSILNRLKIHKLKIQVQLFLK